MSYILDALRKAERERNLGEKPPLAIVTQGGTPQIVSRGPPWTWIAAGGSVVVIAIVVAVVLLNRDPAPSAPEAAAVAAAEAPAPADAMAGDGEPALVPEEHVGEPGPIPGESQVASLQDLYGDGEEPPRDDYEEPPPEEQVYEDPVYEQPAYEEPVYEEPAADEPMYEDPAAGEEYKDEPPPDDESAAEPAYEVPPPQPQVLDPSPRMRTKPAPPAPAAPPPASGPVVESVQLDPAPGTPPRRLKDMPPEYRADFPKFSLDVHVYEDKQPKRWIMINGRRYREGEGIAEGPRIVEIVRDGVVFEHRGQRVLFPTAR